MGAQPNLLRARVPLQGRAGMRSITDDVCRKYCRYARCAGEGAPLAALATWELCARSV